MYIPCEALASASGVSVKNSIKGKVVFSDIEPS